MITIDTHVLVWWVSNPEKLSHAAQKAIKIEKKTGSILISSICIWEVYLLVKKERLKLTIDTDSWLEKIESLPYIQFIPIDNKIAAKSILLPGDFHADLADRIIVTTAREKGVMLVTSDKKIRNYPHVKTLW